jgi:hypothetical protein
MMVRKVLAFGLVSALVALANAQIVRTSNRAANSTGSSTADGMTSRRTVSQRQHLRLQPA